MEKKNSIKKRPSAARSAPFPKREIRLFFFSLSLSLFLFLHFPPSFRASASLMESFWFYYFFKFQPPTTKCRAFKGPRNRTVGGWPTCGGALFFFTHLWKKNNNKKNRFPHFILFFFSPRLVRFLWHSLEGNGEPHGHRGSRVGWLLLMLLLLLLLLLLF